MNVKLLSLLLVFLVVVGGFAGSAGAQVGLDGNGTDNGTQTPTETPEDENETASQVSTNLVDVSPILTVNKAEWYPSNNTVVLTVTADQSHEVTKVWKTNDGLRRDTVTVPQGKSQIKVSNGGFDEVQIWSGSYGEPIERPPTSLVDLDTGEWNVWRFGVGGLFGVIFAVIYKYKIEDFWTKYEAWDLSEIDPTRKR